MRFLADENVHADRVGWFRSQGHDVVHAVETLAGQPDEVVLRVACDERRIVVTDDKDFGNLVVHRGMPTEGVLLLRLRSPSVSLRVARLRSVWPSIERMLPGQFVVVSDRTVRARPTGRSPEA